MFARVFVLICTVLSVAAFVARQTPRVSTRSIAMAAKLGSVEINGGNIWDPLDLLKLHDIAPTAFPHAKWWQESEIKHCRIAMLASVGAFTAQYGLVIPGYNANPDPVTNLNQWVTVSLFILLISSST